MSDYKKAIKVALEEAMLSKKTGNKGYGAVLVKGDKIIMHAHDTVAQTKDPTSHAEMNIIRMAAKKYGTNLSDFILISTCEPCPMCSSASVWANIGKVVYGASIKETITMGRTRLPQVAFNKKTIKLLSIQDKKLKKQCLDLYNY